MAMTLYPHNQKAYEAALALMHETGKAAVIHPTGTGKSFIGLKLCEEHPRSAVCWLSPSEYIFKTQLENWKAAGGEGTENIRFFTYARLVNLTEEELKEIKPDYIILDEFHRCGAQVWGQGVQNLLNLYTNTPILGLSATNIRYLDNQRDMADELFDNNIASEMTLGEAIARGILVAPKYVVSVYSYQKDLEKYQRRIERTRNKAVRDQAERYIEALRRALEKAEGLDEVFCKHITEQNGKHIVFCSGVEQMEDLLECVPEWFRKIDRTPHIYKAYSEDPETNQAFADFKEDNSNHLKLLFCIDMLNEGIHVDDISGVILFRPTVSPIIYKQQIGRALSAGKSREPVIFDIVNNFENLYSIGAVEEEMRQAVIYYRSLDEKSEIVRESFQIIDEVRNCRELFAGLEETLSASWELMFEQAKRYYNENENLSVPNYYKTPEGYSLGVWVFTQRMVRAGLRSGILTESRIQKLDTIGMIWENRFDLSWNKNFAEAKAYYDQYGDLNVPIDYQAESGVKLGNWIRMLRQYRASNIRNTQLTPERIEALDQMGMIWDKLSFRWEQQYMACATYYQQHGNLEIPVEYVNPEGLRTGEWVRTIRDVRNGRKKGTLLTKEQYNRLNAISFVWDDAATRRWNKGIIHTKRHYQMYNNINLSSSYRSEDGFELGRWLARQRELQAKLSLEQKAQLDVMGFDWNTKEPFEERIALCKAYYEQYGNLNIPNGYRVGSIRLGQWVNTQRRIYRGEIKNKQLSPKLIEQLEAVGMDWSASPQERAWENQYQKAKTAYEKKQKPDNALNGWFSRQRDAYNKGRLTKEQIEKLNSIEMAWEVESPWEKNYRALQEYVQNNGNANVPFRYVTSDGIALGIWLSTQKVKYNRSGKGYASLTEDQINRLEALGVVLTSEDGWDKQFEQVKEYYKAHGDVNIPVGYRTEEGCYLGSWLNDQRKHYAKGTLAKERMKALETLGMNWLTASEQKWERGVQAAEQYRKKYGNLKVPVTYRTEDRFRLGNWLAAQVKRMQSGKLNKKQAEQLESLGMNAEKAKGNDAIVTGFIHERMKLEL